MALGVVGPAGVGIRSKGAEQLRSGRSGHYIQPGLAPTPGHRLVSGAGRRRAEQYWAASNTALPIV